MTKERDEELFLPEGRESMWVCEQWTQYKLEQWEEQRKEEGLSLCEITIPGYVGELESYWGYLAHRYHENLKWTDSDALLQRVLEHSQRHAGYEYLDWDVTMVRWLLREIRKRIRAMEKGGVDPFDEEMQMLHYLAFGFYWEEQRMWQVLGEEKKAKTAFKRAKDHGVYIVLSAMRKFHNTKEEETT